MNEWSPGGSYSRPGTPNQQLQLRTFRSQWEEPSSERATKPLTVNIRAVADSRNREVHRSIFQQRSTEDISRTSALSPNRKKKVGADPRFKRVITSGMQNDACVGTELKISRICTAKPEEKKEEPKTEAHNEMQVVEVSKKDVSPKLSPRGTRHLGVTTMEYSSLIIQESNEFEASQHDHLKEVDKLSFPPDIVFPKKSASDCTIRSRNTSFGSEDIGDDYISRLHAFPSATRVSKVHTWMKDHRPKPEKRRSVITVIGQTQGKSILSSTLHEIDQRRKLAKELDKHALCKRILESSDREREITNLVAKLDLLSPAGRIIYGSDKIYSLTESYESGGLNVKDYGDSTERHPEAAMQVHEGYEACEMGDRVPECETLINHPPKRPFAPKRTSRETISNAAFKLKGKIQHTLNRVPYQPLIYFMVVLSGALCWFTIFALQGNSSFLFDILSQKPKTPTWYEELFNWIWEFFRPLSSYQRSTPWNAH